MSHYINSANWRQLLPLQKYFWKTMPANCCC